jgi:hypothetical protein
MLSQMKQRAHLLSHLDVIEHYTIPNRRKPDLGCDMRSIGGAPRRVEFKGPLAQNQNLGERREAQGEIAAA